MQQEVAKYASKLRKGLVAALCLFWIRLGFRSPEMKQSDPDQPRICSPPPGGSSKVDQSNPEVPRPPSVPALIDK